MVKTMKTTSLEIGSRRGDCLPGAIDGLPIAYVEVNAEGVITRSNRTARALHPVDDKDTGYTLGVMSVMQPVKDFCEFVPMLAPEQG
jgi:hypothetical protein